MPKAPSDATKLRTANADIRRLRAELHQVLAERNQHMAAHQAARAELAEWKARFDKLLDRTPSQGATE